MKTMIDTLFSKLGKKFYSDYIISYCLNNENEIKDPHNFDYKYYDKDKYKNQNIKISKDKNVYLKIRQKIRIEKLMDPDYFEENEAEFSHLISNVINLNEEEEEKKEDNLCGRSKENNVAYAIVNVFKWEKIIEHSKLFSKNQNTQALNNNNRKFELQSNTQDDNREIISNERSKQIRKDKAAKLLGISQKTLYHYEKEIKEAFKNKYDFMENYKRKINHLYLHNKKFN
jgi:DNA-binding XRE family transcriptional regulator